MKKAVIVGASPEAFWDGRWTPDFVLCADGGYQKALDLGLKPDEWIGDGDSGTLPCTLPALLLPEEKEESDLQACVRRAMAMGAGEIALLGATGGRLDHFIGNVGLLEALSRNGVEAVILNADNELRICKGEHKLTPPHDYRYFSLLPLDESCSEVHLDGAKYPLQNAALYRWDTRGLSNEPAGADTTVRIRIGRGTVLLIRSERLRSLP